MKDLLMKGLAVSQTYEVNESDISEEYTRFASYWLVCRVGYEIHYCSDFWFELL